MNGIYGNRAHWRAPSCGFREDNSRTGEFLSVTSEILSGLLGLEIEKETRGLLFVNLRDIAKGKPNGMVVMLNRSSPDYGCDEEALDDQ
mgnify:CR=1 FL=1